MTQDFWDSETIRQRYDLVERLGEGGMGIVYRAKDKTLDKSVAIKVVNTDLTADQSIGFQKEAKLSGKLNHKNIVSILDFGVTEANHPYLVMELAKGQSLAQMLTISGFLELEEALPIFIQICQGMIHSHANGVVHRDLKPANIIIVDDDDTLKIVDFGIARLKGADAHLTHSGAFIGSPLYTAPEQTEGVADERSDIYSMGCLMYKVLTGSTPFLGETSVETLLMHKNQQPVSLNEETDRAFPQEIESAVAKCLEKKPENRYQSFQALLADLKAMQSAYGLSKKEEGISEEEETGTDTSHAKAFFGGIQAKKIMIAVAVIAFLVGTIVVLANKIDAPVEKPSPVVLRDQGVLSEPEEPVEAKSLVEDRKFGLDLYLTGYKDKDLASLSKYGKIHGLYLKRSDVTGVGFDSLTDTEITELFLDQTEISFEGLKAICRLPGLQLLSLKKVDTLTDEMLRYIAENSKLKSIIFSGRYINEDSLKQLSGSKTLVKVQICDLANVSAKGVASVLPIRTLEALQFSNCHVNDDAFALMRKTKKLKYFGLSSTTITSRDMDEALRLPVQRLAFVESKVSPAVLKKVMGDRRIFSLNVTSPGITNKERKAILDSFPFLPEPSKNITKKTVEEDILSDKKLFDFGMKPEIND